MVQLYRFGIGGQVGIGAAINKFLIGKRWLFPALLMLACALSLTGGLLVLLLEGPCGLFCR